MTEPDHACRIAPRHGRRWTGRLAAGALLLTLLAGCGRKGDLEPALVPSVGPATSAGESVAPVVRRPKRIPITPSKDSFFLDPLL